ncbi:hypothetical protein CEXT_82171 [Caerostris extrusa]|uniref:Ribosomal protein S18 n=1 Tax=Caerostris extrusa TaxID=172846 RepID=A0AAV4QKA0_CAEEX|nr:hypothetical protein CEXT_82171 [Caerostris extrusa]
MTLHLRPTSSQGANRKIVKPYLRHNPAFTSLQQLDSFHKEPRVILPSNNQRLLAGESRLIPPRPFSLVYQNPTSSQGADRKIVKPYLRHNPAFTLLQQLDSFQRTSCYSTLKQSVAFSAVKAAFGLCHKWSVPWQSKTKQQPRRLKSPTIISRGRGSRKKKKKESILPPVESSFERE